MTSMWGKCILVCSHLFIIFSQKKNRAHACLIVLFGSDFEESVCVTRRTGYCSPGFEGGVVGKRIRRSNAGLGGGTGALGTPLGRSCIRLYGKEGYTAHIPLDPPPSSYLLPPLLSLFFLSSAPVRGTRT